MVNNIIKRKVQEPILLLENCWYVSRYRDVKLVMEEENSSKDFLKWIDPDNAPVGWSDSFRYKELLMAESGGVARLGFGMTDEPEHSEDLKNFIHLFSGKNIERLTSIVGNFVRDTVKENINNKDFDLVRDLGVHVTQQLAANLLGLPEITTVIETVNRHAQVIIDNTMGPEWIKPYSEEHLEDFEIAKEFFVHFLTPIIIDRLQNPKDDFLSNYLKSENADVRTAGVYIVNLVCLTHTVGLGTADCLLFLANNKDIQTQLRTQEKLTLENIEELIRLVGHVPAVIRILKKDLTIDGVVMKKGMVVIVDLPAAGYDPEVFPNPTELDLNRSFKNSLSFGHGIHTCGGRAVGRSVLRRVLEETLINTTDLNVTGHIKMANNGATDYFLNIPFLLGGPRD